MKYVPFMICVIVFIFTSAGYFITDKKTEKIYGALSIVSIACAIVQAAIVFWRIGAESRIPDEKLGIRFFVYFAEKIQKYCLYHSNMVQ